MPVRVSIQMRINPPLQMKQHHLHQPQCSRQYCKYSKSIWLLYSVLSYETSTIHPPHISWSPIHLHYPNSSLFWFLVKSLSFTLFRQYLEVEKDSEEDNEWENSLTTEQDVYFSWMESKVILKLSDVKFSKYKTLNFWNHWNFPYAI